MIYFLGNCQADFVSRAMADKGFDVTYRVLASPLTYPSHPGSIPPSLSETDAAYGLGDYFHGRELHHQFVPILPDETAPELIVLSLFHENTPLFIHNTEQYIFFMEPRALTDKPDMMEWTKKHCQMIQPNPTTYLDRYEKMLAGLRHAHPGVPIVVLSRLSHHPAFGPDPFSYLKGWSKLWPKAAETLSKWTSAFEDVHVLDMDRVFGGIWAQSDAGIESHCPFLKIRLEETDGQVTGLHARRDIEHIGPMPERLAEKLADFLETGAVTYDEREIVPFEWRRQWRIRKLSDEAMLRKLTSGANYLAAEAVAAFFLNLERDHTDLLVQARRFMPVCHMTLHMIKAYSRIFKNPALARWCDTHRTTAEHFTANGPLYQEAYINRVNDIKRHVVG